MMLVGSESYLKLIDLKEFDLAGKIADGLEEFVVEEVREDMLYDISIEYVSKHENEHKSYILHKILLEKENIILSLEADDN